jgi:hypothetical protein
MNPNNVETASDNGTTQNPISRMYKAHRRADSFRTLTTEKSKEPINTINVNPQAAIKKYDIEYAKLTRP